MDEHTGIPDVTRTTEAELVVSQEQLAVSSEWHELGRVRVAKRVVTEERTVTVTVRREVLVVEDVATGADLSHQVLESAGASTTTGTTAGAGSGALGGTVHNSASAGSRPVLELTLLEEQVSLVAVPSEQVRVYVDRVTGTQQVTGTVSREDVELVETPHEHATTPHQGAPS